MEHLENITVIYPGYKKVKLDEKIIVAGLQNYFEE